MDPRIVRGTQQMLAALEAEVAAGAEHIGWKVGFGSPSGMEMLGIDRPLVGYLTAGRRLSPGATVDIGDWTRPLIEAEVAAYVGPDLAVAGWALVVELADLDHAPEDVERILAGNVYHRHVLLGDQVTELPDSLRFTLHRDGTEVAATDRPEELTGDLAWVLSTTASTLAAAGSALRAGDLVITGSVVPPLDIAANESWRVEADGLGKPLTVSLVE